MASDPTELDGVIVDAGLGNVGSLRNMCRRVGADVMISSDPEVVARATRLLLPGVGAFDEGMRRLHERGLVAALETARTAGTPVLGICLGMQLMTNGSEEGTSDGLGWIDAQTVRLPKDVGIRVPHMGWNASTPVRETSIFAGRPDDPDTRYYFVHSYHVRCNDPSDELAVTDYGIRFTSAVQRGSVVATQFHPEKSHRFGMQLLRTYLGVA